MERVGVDTAQKAPTKVWLETKDIGYDVVVKKKKLTILNNLSAVMHPGELVALMGASGAGKTSFLNVLSGVIKPTRGTAQLSGQSMSNNWSKRQCCFIPQDDILLDSFSALEMLSYASRLRMPRGSSSEEHQAAVQWVLEKLSLEKCKDTRIGNAGQRGLSGGQRKRVSIGMELLVNPSVLFVDEATSGLDSKMAADVMQLLADLAVEGRVVVSTIHQPSYEIFKKFHKLLLLDEGRIVFHGLVSDAPHFFSSVGFTAPSFENPADFYLRVLQEDKPDDDDAIVVANTLESSLDTSPGKTDFPSAWEQWSKQHQDGAVVDMQELGAVQQQSTVSEVDMQADNSRELSALQQYFILTERCMYDSVKDKQKFAGCLMMKLMVGVLIAIVFVDQAGTTQDSAFTTEGPLFMLCMQVHLLFSAHGPDHSSLTLLAVGHGHSLPDSNGLPTDASARRARDPQPLLRHWRLLLLAAHMQHAATRLLRTLHGCASIFRGRTNALISALFCLPGRTNDDVQPRGHVGIAGWLAL
jgi:ABC-type multidrug transport system ATPase subunit